MSILLDRLIGYDIDDDSGKTKLGIHPFIDALTLHTLGLAGAPDATEINVFFSLAGQSFDPAETQVADAQLLIALALSGGEPQSGARDVEQVLRLAEYFPEAITQARVESMLGVTLST